MKKSSHQLASRLYTTMLLGISLLAITQSTHAQVIYQTNFDSLTLGKTQPLPGTSGQDGWYREITFGSNYGEIENTIANGGNALHEFSPAANPTGNQSQDARALNSTALSGIQTLMLSYDFYASSSDLSAVNPFDGSIELSGPDGQALGMNLRGGNGAPKSSTGVNAYLSASNGVDNNGSIALTVGQNLAWNTWHSVLLLGDVQTNHYLSLTVDGVTQSLTNFTLPETFPGGTPTRPTTFDILDTDMGANNTTFPGNATDDNIYWDNIKITSTPTTTPEPGTVIFSISGILGAFGVVLKRRSGGHRFRRSHQEIKL